MVSMGMGKGTKLCIIPCSDIPHGTIHYMDQSGEEGVVKFFWSSESLQFGDQVEFLMGVRTYDQFLYAVDIKVLQRAKDIRFMVRFPRF